MVLEIKGPVYLGRRFEYAILIEHAKSDGQIKGVIPHLVDGGLSILQYADDMILFMDHDLEKSRNLKLILAAFEQLSGLNINFHKSELFCFGDAQNDATPTRSCLVVGKANFLLVILGFQFIIRHLQMLNGK
jgi:hypothetical protein